MFMDKAYSMPKKEKKLEFTKIIGFTQYYLSLVSNDTTGGLEFGSSKLA